MTRKAFGLTDVKGQKFPATESLTAADVVADRETLKNVRLWEPSIMAQSYSQLQSIRPYYEFPDVDVDRYTIDGVQAAGARLGARDELGRCSPRRRRRG